MKQPVMSLAALMGTVALMGLGAASLRNASPLWASSLFSVAIALVTTSTVLAMVRPRSARGFWVGSAVFGGVYLAATFGPWPGRAGVTAPPLVSRVLLDLSAEHVHSTDERIMVDAADEGEELAPPGLALESRPGKYMILGTQGNGQRGKVPVMKMPGNRPNGELIVDGQQYRRVGHALIALVAYGLGGLLGALGSRTK